MYPDEDPFRSQFDKAREKQPFAIRSWDGQTVKTVVTALEGVAELLAISPDGSIVAVLGTHEQVKSVKLLEVRTGKIVLDTGLLASPERIAEYGPSIAFSRDGKRIVMATDETGVPKGATGSLVVLDVTTGKRIMELKTRALSPALNHDGTTVTYVGGNVSPTGNAGEAVIADVATGQVRRVIRGHDGGVTSLAFSRDGTVLITVGSDRIKHWDATIDERVLALKDRSDPVMTTFAHPTRDASRQTVGGNGIFQVWGRADKPIFSSPPLALNNVAPPPVGPPMPKVGDTPPFPGQPGPNPPKVGEMLPPPKVFGPNMDPNPPEVGPRIDPKKQPALPPDNDPARKYVKASDIVGVGKPFDSTPSRPLMSAMGFGASYPSPDGKRAVFWNFRTMDNGTKRTDETELYLWDPDANRQLISIVQEGKFHSAVFSPNSKRLAAVLQPQNVVRLWDAETGRELHSLPIPKGGQFRLAFSPDTSRLGAFVFTEASSIEVALWEVESGQAVPVAPLPDKSGWKFPMGASFPTFDGTGKRIALALRNETGENIVRVWDVETGARPVDLKTDRGIRSVGVMAFSPDGRRLAMAEGQTVKIWNPDSGAELLAILMDGFQINHLNFTADGNVIELVVKTRFGFETRRLDGTPRATSKTP
jgi:WD40 repeat protein